jgi:serine beta-lactamase-like protein LACTB
MRKLLRLTWLITLCIFSLPLFSQRIVSGKTLSKPGNRPVPYTNIGIIGTPIGTISNTDGSFLIQIPKEYQNDTLIFYSLGFGQRAVPLLSLSQSSNLTIFLKEKSTTLEAVEVSAKKSKNKKFWFGNRYAKGGSLYADSVAAGSAMALLIENKYPSYHNDLQLPVYLEQVRIQIFRNTMGNFKLRVRLCEVDSITGIPGKDLLDKNVIVESNVNKGWLDIDMTPYNITLDTIRFFLVVEWLMTEQDRLSLLGQYKQYRIDHPERVTIDTSVVDGKKVSYYSWHGLMAGTFLAVSRIPFSLNNYKAFVRENSFGEWKRSPSIPTITIHTSDQRPSKRTTTKRADETCKGVTCAMQKKASDFLNEHNVNGMQLAVGQKNTIVFSEAFGFADEESGRPTTTRTQFRIGSVSKSVTSAALIKLVADGKLDLDAPIQKYVPSFSELKYPVTTRQLAGHLAGIRHYNENDIHDLVRTEHFDNATDAIRIFKNDSLLFKPGTQFHYSSYGWNLIGAVIEGATHTNFLRYLDKNIWEPLGMHQTYGDKADSLMSDRSTFYEPTGQKASFEDLSYKYPGGGLLSTAEDLVRLGNELLHGNYFDNDLKKVLFTSQRTTDGKETNYGLGWYIGKDNNGHRVWFHAGDLMNSSAYLLIYPDDDLVIAFAANSQEGLLFDIRSIAPLYYRK